MTWSILYQLYINFVIRMLFTYQVNTCIQVHIQMSNKTSHTSNTNYWIMNRHNYLVYSFKHANQLWVWTMIAIAMLTFLYNTGILLKNNFYNCYNYFLKFWQQLIGAMCKIENIKLKTKTLNGFVHLENCNSVTFWKNISMLMSSICWKPQKIIKLLEFK